MNKKLLFGIILGLTIFILVLILVFSSKTKYNKLIVNDNKWSSIINSKKISNSIKLESIEFNDYNLLIDEDSSTIYYSIVDVSNKYNPSVKYNTNKKVNIIVNSSITDKKLEQTDSLKIMIYNDKYYRIYTLVATKYPILNITYQEKDNNKRKLDMELELFDNYINSHRRVLKSNGLLRIIEEDKIYSFSLIKESLGHNERDNHISIFGMKKQNEYLIKATNTINDKERYVQFFINNKYRGIYTFGHNEERRIDNFERNRENNR